MRGFTGACLTALVPQGGGVNQVFDWHSPPVGGLWAHVRVLDVIKSDVDELDLQLDITLDNVFVVIVREVVQIARGVSKKNVNQVLVGNTNENLACALGIDGSIFDIARWSGSVNHQATCV